MELTFKNRIALLYLLVAGLLCLWHGLWPAGVQTYGLPLLFASVLTVGMVHGCLDYELEAKRAGVRKPLAIFLVQYVAQMALMGGVWYLVPGLGLLLFLLYTGWHFGETDFGVLGLPPTPWRVFLYGAGLIVWILGWHMAETLAYLSDLSVLAQGSDLQASFLINKPWYVAGALVAIVSSLKLGRSSPKPVTLVFVLLLLITTAFLPLLPGFALYFGFWHALHSLQVIKQDLNLSYGPLLRRALPYLAASVGGAVLLIAGLAHFNLNAVLVLFIFISALTTPHAGIMHGVFERRYKRQIAVGS